MSEGYSAAPGRIAAACAADTGGGFTAGSFPYNVASVGAPAASVYLVTIQAGIDATVAVPIGTCVTANRQITIAQASDTTFNASTVNSNTGAAANDSFLFMVIRTKTA